MKIKQPWWPLLRIERAILIITSILAAGLVTVGVFTRYVLRTDFLGMEELVGITAMWLYWVGGLYASRNDNHIQGNLVDTFVTSSRAKKIHRLCVLAISLVVIAVFAKWSFDYVAWSIERGATSTALKIPMTVAHLPLLIGFVMMFAYTGYHLVLTSRTKEDDYDAMVDEVHSWS